jgi:hypothetical protein
MYGGHVISLIAGTKQFQLYYHIHARTHTHAHTILQIGATQYPTFRLHKVKSLLPTISMFLTPLFYFSYYVAMQGY